MGHEIHVLVHGILCIRDMASILWVLAEGTGVHEIQSLC